MNLIEELADVIADSGTHYGKAMNLLPIFAEWIKNISVTNPYLSNGIFANENIKVAHNDFEYGVKTTFSTILSELEKMK
jgi:hypothetical protein